MSGNQGSLNKAIWGPHFWSMLHGLAEAIFVATDTPQLVDIMQEWARLTRYLSEVLPCTVCQEHARLWRRPNFNAEAPEEPRNWTYQFHESVRERLHTNGKSFPIVELKTYKLRNEDMRVVLDSIQQGVDAGIVIGDSARAFRRHLSRLRTLLESVGPRKCTCVCTCGAAASPDRSLT